MQFAYTCMACALALCPVAAALSSEAADKPYILYMGTDFAVQQGKAFLSVRDLKGNAFVVHDKRREILVPMTASKVNLKIEQSLRVAHMSAKVEALKMERAYTMASDPYRQFSQTVGGSLAAAAELDMAVNEQVSAQQMVTVMPNAPMGLASADAAMSRSMATMNFSTIDNTGEKALSLQQALAAELYDAMEISFEASSPEYLDKPYVVVIVRYHEQDATTRDSKNWVFAKAIAPIAAGPEKIRFLQGGLPRGFQIEESQVRLYNRGKEIATNVAPRRVELSKDDAFEYLKMQRVSSTTTASLPASPALRGLTQETKSRLTPDQLNQIYYVKVSREGRAIAGFNDEACSSPVDDTMAGVIGEVRFYPTLNSGKPTEGVSKLVLSQLSM